MFLESVLLDFESSCVCFKIDHSLTVFLFCFYIENQQPYVLHFSLLLSTTKNNGGQLP